VRQVRALRNVIGNRILLITNNRCTTPYPVFPLGIGHVAAALTRSSYTVKIVDLFDTSIDLGSVLQRFKPDFIGVSQRNFDDIQIKNTRVFADDIVSLVKQIRKRSSVPIVLGGSGFSLFPREMLELTGAEFGVQAEGEQALPELISVLNSGRSYTGIPGLVYRHGKGIVVNKKKACPPRLIAPALRPASLSALYLQKGAMQNIQTQRGCNFKCCYCTYPLIEGTRVRHRVSGDILGEMKQIKKSGAKYFFIVDSVFNTSNKHVTEICEGIIKNNIKLSWGCFLRPQGLTADLMGLMARAGLTHIEFGSDSFCDSVLEAYGKQFSFDDIFHASELARKVNVHYAHFLIIGGPSETEKTMRKSFINSKKLRKTVHFPFVGMRIYPGTKLDDFARREGFIPGNAGLFKPRFYVTPHITRSSIFAMLRQFNAQSHNWIVGDLPPSLVTIVQQLRAKGIVGPLWEFLAR
jgi:Fe-S oxidoreductase